MTEYADFARICTELDADREIDWKARALKAEAASRRGSSMTADIIALKQSFTWTQTRSGKKFDLLFPKVEQVDLRDIAFHLSHTPRYAGATGGYSVAQHSLHVANEMPFPHRAYGLLHDAHEAYIGDITRPVQAALGEILDSYCEQGALAHALEIMKREIDRVIHEACGLPWPLSDESRVAIKMADYAVLMAEKRDLHQPAPEPWGYECFEPMAERISSVMTPGTAEFFWLRELGRCGVAGVWNDHHEAPPVFAENDDLPQVVALYD
jgi:hypothetical protein